MHSFTAQEANKFFQSYEVKCDEEVAQEWLDTKNPEDIGTEVTEDDVWKFTEWWMYKGTAYEEGIDDKIKIERLLSEVQRLEEKNDKLENEIVHLELKLGIMPF